jgi:hypothetical protein
MNDATVKKVSEKSAPKGSMDQTYLVSGKRVAMRLWEPFTAVETTAPPTQVHGRDE